MKYTLVVADTETMASAVSRHFPNVEILTCPDPTSRSPQTSSAMGLSDHAILSAAVSWSVPPRRLGASGTRWQQSA